jgi:outer membrane protein, heavy metal efflux system
VINPLSTKRLLNSLGIGLISATLLVACTKTQYRAKPIASAAVTEKLLNKDTTSKDFQAYLIKNGYQARDLPFTSWGLNELTYCALYHHTKLDVAKAQLALANANLESAGLKQNPTLTGNLARSNQANNDIRPWAYGLNVEIPIETAHKRDIKIEEAQHLVEVARLDVADTAWQLRSQIAKDLLAYHESDAQQQALTQALQKQDALIQILEKRLQLGAISNTELNAAKLAHQKMLSSLHTTKNKTHEIRATLAADVGLSNEKFTLLQLKPLDLDAKLTQLATYIGSAKPNQMRENVLLNRLDIRRSLEKYAAAEAKIKLEVAKQTPDISLSPGIAFEFGDRIWSLGFASLLNLLNNHPTFIQEAIQLREVEGAQFEALQAKVLGDLDLILAQYQASQENLNHVKQQQAIQLSHHQKLQQQFEAGLIDRFDLTQSQLNTHLLAQEIMTAQFNHLNNALALEDLMQRPIFDDFTMPTSFSYNPSAQSVGTSHE